MIQLILHLWGDYLTQSDWMAQNKTKAWFPALVHATVYSLPFLLIGSAWAVLVIWSTHAVIDRYRLARYVCWAKNWLALPRREKWQTETYVDPSRGPFSETKIMYGHRWIVSDVHPWKECTATGYHHSAHPFMAVWLMILADNTLHLTINFAAIALFS